MKELEINNKDKTEISIKQKKQVEHRLIDKIIPYDGHKIWEINNKTLETQKAKFSTTTYHIGKKNKKEIMIKKDHSYISALNKKNALRKFNQGRNGSKPVAKEPAKLYRY